MTSVPVKVATVISDSLLAFNAGTNRGIRAGDMATVYRIVEVSDPETKEKLGAVSVPKLSLRINHVQEKLCTGIVTSAQDEPTNVNVTRVRKLKRIVESSFDEKAGINVYVSPGDPSVIEIKEESSSDEPPF